MAYVYPHAMRSTRDLLRRRLYLARQNAQLQTHIQNTNTQYNLPSFEKRINHRSNRTGIGDRFTDPMVRTSVEVDVALMDTLHEQILTIERQINAQVPEHDPVAVHLLRSIPGVGKTQIMRPRSQFVAVASVAGLLAFIGDFLVTLALVIFYEIHDINRFPKVGNFISYARLAKCAHESAGKRRTGKNSKIGNAKALSIIAQKLGRTVYTMLKRRTPFDAKRVFETVG